MKRVMTVPSLLHAPSARSRPTNVYFEKGATVTGNSSPRKAESPCFQKSHRHGKVSRFHVHGTFAQVEIDPARIAVGQIETNVLVSQNIFRQAIFHRIESQPERGTFKAVPSDEEGESVHRAVVPAAEQHAALLAERFRRAETDGRSRQQVGPDLASAYFHTPATGSTDYGFGNRAVASS